MGAINEAAPLLKVAPGCAALGLSRATLYRRRTTDSSEGKRPVTARPAPPGRALTEAERDEVQGVLNSAQFCDAAPRQVYAHLLDDGRYLCSVSTM